MLASERASSMSLLDALSRGPRAARPAKRAPAAMVGGGVEEDAELDVKGALEESEDAELDVEGALDRELEALEREHHDGSDSDVSIVDSRHEGEEVEAEPEVVPVELVELDARPPPVAAAPLDIAEQRRYAMSLVAWYVRRVESEPGFAHISRREVVSEALGRIARDGDAFWGAAPVVSVYTRRRTVLDSILAGCGV